MTRRFEDDAHFDRDLLMSRTLEFSGPPETPPLPNGSRIAIVMDGERRFFTVADSEKTRDGWRLQVTLDEVQR